MVPGWRWILARAMMSLGRLKALGKVESTLSPAVSNRGYLRSVRGSPHATRGPLRGSAAPSRARKRPPVDVTVYARDGWGDGEGRRGWHRGWSAGTGVDAVKQRRHHEASEPTLLRRQCGRRVRCTAEQLFSRPPAGLGPVASGGRRMPRPGRRCRDILDSRPRGAASQAVSYHRVVSCRASDAQERASLPSAHVLAALVRCSVAARCDATETIDRNAPNPVRMTNCHRTPPELLPPARGSRTPLTLPVAEDARRRCRPSWRAPTMVERGARCSASYRARSCIVGAQAALDLVVDQDPGSRALAAALVCGPRSDRQQDSRTLLNRAPRLLASSPHRRLAPPPPRLLTPPPPPPRSTAASLLAPPPRRHTTTSSGHPRECRVVAGETAASLCCRACRAWAGDR